MFASIRQQQGDIIACLKGDKSFANCEFKSLFQMSQRAANWPIPYYARDDSFIRTRGGAKGLMERVHKISKGERVVP